MMVARGKGENMSSGNLENFAAYTKSLELFDQVVDDMDKYMRSHRVERLVSQQMASSDSVASNIEALTLAICHL